jgi:small GTP-binding protein
MSSPYIVAFCGLPSSGKSTLINSLVGERILQSGVCRTTTEMNELSNEVIIDDNGNKFVAIDLPGICDSEEKNINFNDITEAHITRANLVCFVSDVNKAFITTHEVNEYKKIKKIVKNLEKENGTIYDVAIILTKCDFNEELKEKKTKVPSKNTREISDSDEDTDLGDLIKKAKEKLPDEDIILFNAFGRIRHSNRISQKLKRIVEKSGVNPTYNNTSFSIKKYCYEIQRRQELSYVEKFNERMKLFIENKIQFENVMNAFENMNEENQYYIVENYSEQDVNYRIFDFICTSLARKKHFYNKNKTKFSQFYIKYYIHMLNNNMLNKTQNFVGDYQSKIWECIQNKFSDLSFDSQNNMIDNVIFEGIIFTNIGHSLLFVQNCFVQTGGFEKYNFMNKFNNLIKLNDKEKFYKFYNIIFPFCTPKNVQIPQVPLQNIRKERYKYQCNFNRHKMQFNTHGSYGNFPCHSIVGHEQEANGQLFWYSNINQPERCKTCGQNITVINETTNNNIITKDNNQLLQIINKYLSDLKELINDPKYILFNKLQILKYLFDDYNINIKQTYHFKENKLKGNNIIEQKILNYPEFIKIEKRFYEKFIGNLIISYDKPENFIFLSIDEILYIDTLSIDNEYETI